MSRRLTGGKSGSGVELYKIKKPFKSGIFSVHYLNSNFCYWIEAKVQVLIDLPSYVCKLRSGLKEEIRSLNKAQPVKSAESIAIAFASQQKKMPKSSGIGPGATQGREIYIFLKKRKKTNKAKSR